MKIQDYEWGKKINNKYNDYFIRQLIIIKQKGLIIKSDFKFHKSDQNEECSWGNNKKKTIQFITNKQKKLLLMKITIHPYLR